MRITSCVQNLNKMLDLKSLKMLETYSTYNPVPLSIKDFMNFGQTATEEESFNFLRKEFPVRLSNIMKEINLLPANLLEMPSVMTLQEWYSQSFKELVEYITDDTNKKGSVDEATLARFCQTLKTIQHRHNNVVQTMAQGVLELKDSHKVDNQTDMNIQYFLDRFYMSRISLRMLLHQHILLFEPDADKQTNRIGMIDPGCKVKSVILEAFQNASMLCEDYYDLAPDIEIKGQTLIKNEKGKKAPLSLCYPPPHLYHILYELFKNSMRATVEKHRTSSDLPGIEVLVAKGDHDVSIRISDQGGGIPRHITDHLFHYLYSTAPRPSMTPVKAPLAGYGYGLPLSRLYARYFHGDLILNSYDGYGTDAVVYLKTSTLEATELLPVFNKTSKKQYNSSIATADWTDPSFSGANRGILSGNAEKKKVQKTQIA